MVGQHAALGKLGLSDPQSMDPQKVFNPRRKLPIASTPELCAFI
jgi:hypothetical protein